MSRRASHSAELPEKTAAAEVESPCSVVVERWRAPPGRIHRSHIAPDADTEASSTITIWRQLSLTQTQFQAI
jgi:hypothetical protein